ncbi:MAG: inositol monophosphatase [Oscillospiraceae bacterium]|nr:inositol monophosphatase [Oscillospiraceae bacterium]
MELIELLNGIVKAEHKAAEIMLHAKKIMAENKSGQRDVVTEFDRKVQELLIAELSDLVPGAKFFCEENDRHDDLKAEHLFIIDPIDGTMNFVRHMNHSCISVAYASCGELVAAAVYNPYVDEMFTAVKGKGAWLNGREIHVEDKPLSETLVCCGTSPYNPLLTDPTFDLLRKVFPICLDIRRQGSAELDLCSAASGRAGVYFELCVSLWDYAAGMLIVQEAGGICCTLEGKPMPLDSSKPTIVAGGRQAVEDVLVLAGV